MNEWTNLYKYKCLNYRYIFVQYHALNLCQLIWYLAAEVVCGLSNNDDMVCHYGDCKAVVTTDYDQMLWN